MPPRRHPELAPQVLEAIGGRIQSIRLAAGISQEEAAARAEIDYKRWQRLEAGEVNATVATLVRVAEALGTTFWKITSKH